MRRKTLCRPWYLYPVGRQARPGEDGMKITEPCGRQRLSFLLEKAASREAEMWKAYVPKRPFSQDTDISPEQRDEAVRWLTELHGRLQLHPETLVSAVSILDRFLAPIKARPKYLRCIAIASFFLAAKTCEEDEWVPSLKELAATSGCGCSPSEILRMEKIVLDKLGWDLHTATPLDFLHIFHAMVLAGRSGSLDSTLGLSLSQHLALLTQRLYHCLADHTLLQLRGSMLALALITLELETCCPDWLALTIDLLGKAQIDSSELIRGREMVARSLSTPRAPLPANTVYICHALQLLAPAPRPPRASSGTIASTSDPTRDHSPAAAALPTAAEEEEGSRGSSSCNLPALLPLPKQPCPLNQLVATLRCKASTKRKVEQMDVDDFYDGIKRLYNEDNPNAAVQEGAALATGEGGGLSVCNAVTLSRQEAGSTPCPPLQPATSS
ncbi:cyclin-I isoform X4 [Oryzias latipes]